LSTRAWWQWLLLLAVLPAVLTVALPDWFYSQSDYIDAWVYHGFFRHLETYAGGMFPRTYYGSRLGWIVPGYVAYHLFSPRIATIVLHLTFYSVAVSSVYLIVRRISNASSALFAAVAFGLYLPAIRSLGSDYVDGAVITYGLASVALGLHGLERVRPWAVVASGAAAGAMLHSNIGAVLVIPSILVWFVPNRREDWLDRSFMRTALQWALGIAACTIALSLISMMTGGTWDFFMQSVRWLQTYRFQNPWDVEGLSWVGQSPWLFLPLATLVAAVIDWFRRRNEITDGQIRAVASLGLIIGIFALWDFVGTGSVLYWPFYASWLIPWTFLVIGSVLIAAVARTGVDAAILVVSTLALGGSLAWPPDGGIPGFGFIGLMTTVGLMVVAVLLRNAAGGQVLCLISVVLLNRWVPMSNLYPPRQDRADAFGAIDRGVRIIERYAPVAQPRFLLTPPGRLDKYIQGLTSVYLWGYTIASSDFPGLTPAQAATISPGAMVIVISERPDGAEPFDRVFAPYHLQGVHKGAERLDTALGPIYLTFLEARAS
jgi:hypothetical protein